MREDEREREKNGGGGNGGRMWREAAVADREDAVCLGWGFGTHTTLPHSSRGFTLKSVHLLEPAVGFLFFFF